MTTSAPAPAAEGTEEEQTQAEQLPAPPSAIVTEATIRWHLGDERWNLFSEDGRTPSEGSAFWQGIVENVSMQSMDEVPDQSTGFSAGILRGHLSVYGEEIPEGFGQEGRTSKKIVYNSVDRCYEYFETREKIAARPVNLILSSDGSIIGYFSE